MNGGPGHRSQYLTHAKRALYHLSYIPNGLSGESNPGSPAPKAGIIPLDH